MSNTDSGYVGTWEDARAQPASNNKHLSRHDLNQQPQIVPRDQYPEQLHLYRDPGGPSDSALTESLPDFGDPSPFDSLYNQETETFPPAAAADSALAGLVGSESGSFGIGPLTLDYDYDEDTMTPNTSGYPDPSQSSSDLYQFFLNNNSEPWNILDSASFNDTDMPAGNTNYRQTLGVKRRRVDSDSGIETQISPTSPQDSSPPTTQLSVSKPKKVDKHFCDLCKAAKTNGFTTTNDLIRHKKGVHGVFESGDKIWRCQVLGCACADKIWPRRDNFLSHLKRMHFNNDDNQAKAVIDTYQECFEPTIHGSMTVAKSGTSRDGARSKPGPSSSSTMAPPTISPFVVDSMLQQDIQSRQASQQYSIPDFHSDGVRRGISAGPRSSFSGHENRPAFTTSRSGFYQRPSYVNPATLQLSPSTMGAPKSTSRPRGARTAPPNTSTISRQKRELEEDHVADQFSHTKSSMEDFNLIGQGFASQNSVRPNSLSKPSSGGGSLNLEASASDSEQTFQDLKIFYEQLPSETRKIFQRHPPKVLAQFFSKIDEDEESDQTQIVRKRSVSKPQTKKNADDGKTLTCDYPIPQRGDRKGSLVQCNVSFSSRSELRKHKIRHDKRFGCTFDKCYSKFGTKWEWKRHEHSQHYQSEAWRCDYTQDDLTCQELFRNETEFRAHLAHHLGDINKQDFDREIAACHLATKWLGSFWCGYCRCIQKSTKEFGKKMDAERVDHIGGHILKGCKSSDWVELNGKGKTKGQMQEEEEEGNGDQKSQSNFDSMTSPTQSYLTPEGGEDEFGDDVDYKEQDQTTSPSDSDSMGPQNQYRIRPSALQVSTQSSRLGTSIYGSQNGPMSAPPAINLYAPDGLITPGHMLEDENAKAMRQAQFYMMNNHAIYQQQHQNQQQSQHQPQMMPASPTARCCGCQNLSMLVNNLPCWHCQHRFCPTCSYTVAQSEFSQNVYPSGDGSGYGGFGGV